MAARIARLARNPVSSERKEPESEEDKMSVMPGDMLVSRDPPPLWRRVLGGLARVELHTAPDPQPGELYVRYEGDPDICGNVRFALYWREPWTVIERKGVTAGTTRCHLFFCDDRMLHRNWLLAYERIIVWPTGADITDYIREQPWS
jgi:hypothetical protein